MKQGATRLRRIPETAEELAEMPTRASPDAAVASRAIPIDLRPVISAYRKRGRFMLRVEKLPQLARFSAGQNNSQDAKSHMRDCNSRSRGRGVRREESRVRSQESGVRRQKSGDRSQETES